MVKIKEFVNILQENKIKSVSVYNLSSGNEEKFVILSTAMKTTDSKKVADIIAEKYGYDDKIGRRQF